MRNSKTVAQIEGVSKRDGTRRCGQKGRWASPFRAVEPMAQTLGFFLGYDVNPGAGVGGGGGCI